MNYQALAGAVAPRPAETPAIPRVPIADLAAATVAALLICAAWAKRLQTGEGERIDVAMADVWRVGRPVRPSRIAIDAPAGGSPGYGVFRAADGGCMTLAVIAEDHFWAAVCDALGLAELAALTYGERLDRIDECNAAVAGAIADLDRDAAVARLTAAGAPVAPALTPAEMAAERQFRERQVFVEDDDGQLRIGFPVRLCVRLADPDRRRRQELRRPTGVDGRTDGSGAGPGTVIGSARKPLLRGGD